MTVPNCGSFVVMWLNLLQGILLVQNTVSQANSEGYVLGHALAVGFAILLPKN